jgi:N-methylhydantoinase B/oxoprolinase/acetone carboxylase alpha subunit
MWILQAGGGGGYGDVQRDPQLVMKDLREQRISHWVAENVDHVVYDYDTLLVDSGATDRARAAERQARLQRGKPYDGFVGQ